MECLQFTGTSNKPSWELSGELYPNCGFNYYLTTTPPGEAQIQLTTGWTVAEIETVSYSVMYILVIALGFKFMRKSMGF